MRNDADRSMSDNPSTNGSVKPVVDVTDLHAGYGGAEIVHGVSFEVPSRSIATIVGPNGSGKSTIMKAVYGLIEPSSGSVTINGTEVTGRGTVRRIHAGAAFVPQLPSIFPDMSVHENLEMGCFTIRSKSETKDRISQALDLFPRLADRSAQRAGTLSGGERRLLEIGRALLLEPSFLMLDEPSVGLAPNLVTQLFDRIQRLRDDLDLTILMIEQNARTALSVSDQGLVVKDGTIAFAGAGDMILSDQAIARTVIGYE